MSESSSRITLYVELPVHGLVILALLLLLLFEGHMGVNRINIAVVFFM